MLKWQCLHLLYPCSLTLGAVGTVLPVLQGAGAEAKKGSQVPSPLAQKAAGDTLHEGACPPTSFSALQRPRLFSGCTWQLPFL